MHDSILVGNYDSFLMSRVILSMIEVMVYASKDKMNVLEGYAKVMSIPHGTCVHNHKE